MLLTTDWTRFGAPADVLKSGTCVSGMYELRPVLLSARSAYVKLAAEEEDEFSAIRHLDRLRYPVTIALAARKAPNSNAKAGPSPRRCARAACRATS